MSVDLGFVLVDTAAAQALIGESALRSLERQLDSFGMQVATLDAKRLPMSAGVGGCGKVTKMVLVFVCSGDKSGIIEFVVLEQDIPTVAARWPSRVTGSTR